MMEETQDQKRIRTTELANAVAESLDAAVYVYSGAIDDAGYFQLIECIQISDEQPEKKNALLILTTNGGLAHSAYQIARLLQTTSERLILCIPSRCKSAGTLVALGAHEILMSGIAEFGPLDVQLVQKDEIGERRSGMVVRSALSGLADETYSVWRRIMLDIKFSSGLAISFDVASRLAAEMAVGVMAPVYAQISPDALGKDLRDLNVATAYGDRLAKIGRNVNGGAVKRLVEGYPTHSFIIDREETGELFRNVNDVPRDLSDLITEIRHIVYSVQDQHFVSRLDSVEKEKENGNDTEERKSANGSPRVEEGRKKYRNSDAGSVSERGGSEKKPTEELAIKI